MNKQRLLGLMLVLAGCQPEKDITPDLAPAIVEVTGKYQTNGYLDLLTITLPTEQLPTADVKAQSDSEVTLTLHQYYPATRHIILEHVGLARQSDSSIRLSYQGQVIGSYQTDRLFTNSGMEAQGKVLRISKTGDESPMVFVGYK